MTTTTTAVTDRNEAFAAERAAQYAAVEAFNAGIPARREAAEKAAADLLAKQQERIASGELRDNGNGTLTVMTGWDAGETLRMRSLLPSTMYRLFWVSVPRPVTLEKRAEEAKPPSPAKPSRLLPA